MMYYILTKDRNINLLSQNKCSSFNVEENSSYISIQSFNQQMRKKYNSLPRGLTLSPNMKLFHKWLYKYHNMSEFDKFPKREDNRVTLKPVHSLEKIIECIN